MLLKKAFTVVLILAVAALSAPLAGIPLVSAANWDEVLTYETNSEETGVIITGCDTSASGVLRIPELIDGLPVVGISDSAFANCASLTNITLPDSVTSLGDSAFFNCSDLESVTLSSHLTSIEAAVFYGCESLAAIEIPDGVTSIGDYAFSMCESLTELIIPDSVESLGEEAISYCASLTEITIPDSVTSIGGYAFFGCSSMTAINVDANNSVFSDIDGVLFDKSAAELLCYPAGNIGSYTIPNSVQAIGSTAFFGCENLTAVTIPNSVTVIGDEAYLRCTSLTEITIPGSVTNIGANAFCACSSLTDLNMKNGVETIGYAAFISCSALENIVIPNSLSTIEAEAFADCGSLKTVEIPDSVTNIGDNAFGFFFSFDSYVYEPYGDFFIYCCENTAGHAYAVNYGFDYELKDSILINISGISVETPPNCTNYFLNETPDTTGLTLTASYKDGSALTLTDGFTCALAALTVPGTQTVTVSWNDFETSFDVTVAPYMCGLCDGGTGIMITYCDSSVSGVFEIPSEIRGLPVKRIGDSAFAGCSSLQKVVIPYGLTSVGDSAFSDCSSLTGVALPKSVTSIGEKAFGFNNAEDFLIKCIDGSAGHTYAVDNSIDFELLDALTLIAGSEFTPSAGFVTASDPMMTASAVMAQFTNENISIYKDGTPLSGSAYTGTGCIIRLTEDGTIMDMLSFVKTGDLNGDSVTDALDVALVNSAMNHHLTLESAYYEAANLFAEDSEIEINDFSAVMNLAVGNTV